MYKNRIWTLFILFVCHHTYYMFILQLFMIEITILIITFALFTVSADNYYHNFVYVHRGISGLHIIYLDLFNIHPSGFHLADKTP